MNAVEPAVAAMAAQRQGLLARIVRERGRQLWGFIRARVRNDADAEDILQDVWRQLAASIDASPIQEVSAWLYTVARHRIIDRARKPQMASLDAPAPAAADADDPAFEIPRFVLLDEATPETEYLKRLFWEQLQAALAELPKEQRQVFVWHELEGMSFQDIAALTGDNLNTLLSRKRYAVLHLRRRLEDFRADFL
jgi:RNA polymerase sigma factor (sigma-70 family)